MAIETEKKGTAFYKAVAAGAKTPQVKDFCLRMAAAEIEHEATFKAMLAPLTAYEPTESYPGEYLNYINALLEHDVMPSEEQGRKLANEAESELEAIDFAIQFEKSTILFLHEMKNFVPEKDRSVIDKLIDEERSHVTGLARLRKTILS
jgi:rubrerythrin